MMTIHGVRNLTRQTLSVLLLAAFSSSVVAAEPPTLIGRKIADFALQDYRGKGHALADYPSKHLVVVAFLGTECPLAKFYGQRLGKLADEYAPRGVTFLGIDSNVQDSVTGLAAFARQHEIRFPLLRDVGNRVADEFGAQRTPEVFVLDASRTVRYRGRVDDQYGIGFIRDKPKRRDLAVALDELLAGSQVTVAETVVTGCLIGRVRAPRADSKINYAEHIAPLLNRRCVECHREGEIAPFALTNYEHVAGWAEMIAEVVSEGRMPPWHADSRHGKFANDRRLTDEEREMVRTWVAGGAPPGDLTRAPPIPSASTGWQLPRIPDLVVPMRDRPFEVPAEGPVRYQYFVADPGLQEDRWLAGIEVAPGNRSVVHHILVFALPPKGRGEGIQQLEGGVRGYLAAYVPGLRAVPYPQGMAKHLPAGSRIVFQIHYTPNGSRQQDLSKVAFLFEEPGQVKYEVKTTSAAQRFLWIPPKADNHKVEATSRSMSQDALLLGMMPHMHLRGKAFSYEAIYPDGQREMLMDVPRYDFNWQTSYRLAEPKKFPSGTRVRCIAHFDNSENNLSNPDPTKTVRWGEQTWEEMMIGYFDIAVKRIPENDDGVNRQ